MPAITRVNNLIIVLFDVTDTVKRFNGFIHLGPDRQQHRMADYPVAR